MFGLLIRKKDPREIFHYHDGERERSADPMAVFRKLSSHPEFELDQQLKEIGSGDLKLSLAASSTAIAAAREAFEIEPWSEENPSGLTEIETIDLLVAFCEYINGLKKNGSG